MKLNIDTKTIFKVASEKDPDKYSKGLGEAHCTLWSSKNKLKNLQWTPYNKLITVIDGVEFIFTPDSITNSFKDSDRLVKGCGKKEKEVIKNYSQNVQRLIKEYVDTDYTIGSSIIFPISINGESIKYTMNIARGMSAKVHDRIDYTLECIKRYYEKTDDNPLIKAIEKSGAFFKLFNSFKEYVDFFFMNDLIDESGNVIGFTGLIDFNNPFPKTSEEYMTYLKNTMSFVEKRNRRIQEYVDKYIW